MKKAITLLTFVLCLFSFNLEAKKSQTNQSIERIYNQPLTSQNKKDITFIVKTLGLGSLTKIIGNKSAMKKAGDRIQSVHPLDFLAFVFTNEELKACAHNIRNSNIPLVWSEFWGGLSESLKDEYANGNVNDKQVLDFSKRIGIDPAHIIHQIHAGKWQDFFDQLLKYIPRDANAGRYNI